MMNLYLLNLDLLNIIKDYIIFKPSNNEELDTNTILEDVYPGKTYNKAPKGRRILKLYSTNATSATAGYVKSVNDSGNVHDHIVSGTYT